MSISILNLDIINKNFNDGDVVDTNILLERRLIKRNSVAKILGNGILDKKIHFSGQFCSEKARVMITKLGGTVSEPA